MSLLTWFKNLKKNKKIQHGFASTMAEPGIATSYNITYNTSDVAQMESPKGEWKDERITAKPKDVMSELADEKDVNLDFTNLKEKIKVVKARLKFMREDLQLPASEEAQAVEWLEARLRYSKIKKGFDWQITTQAKVNALCKKYKVTTAGVSGYHRCVPQEAIDEMKKYMTIYRKVTNGKEPNIRLVVDQAGHDQDSEQKKDPIVLAQSPFGAWEYVLGGWDKEVEIMDKLYLRA